VKKVFILVVAFGCALCLSGNAAFAQGRGGSNAGGQGRGPAVTPNAPSQSHAGETKGPKESKGAPDTAKGGDFVARIDQNPNLKAKVDSLLPPGTNLATAASGFKNQGQFIAALHVSKNLNIPFNDLKAKMTGPNAEPLGKAIHDLKPTLTEKDADQEASKAQKEAKETEKAKTT
jgi:hypothetical protein